MLAAMGEFFREAGTFIFCNVAVLGVAIVVAGLRLWKLHWLGRISGLPFVTHIDGILERDTIDAAKAECERWPDAAVAEVIKAGLEAAPEGDSAVKYAVETAETITLSKALRGHQTLNTLANLGVYFGLIGTIIGLTYHSFGMGMASTDNRMAMMTMKISDAMNHTAFGLIVALFCSAAQLSVRSLIQSALGDIMVASEYIKLALRERREWLDEIETPTTKDDHPPPPMWAIDRFMEERG